jgi:hypothetical protein
MYEWMSDFSAWSLWKQFIIVYWHFVGCFTVGMFHRFSQYLHVHDVCGNYVFIKIHIIRGSRDCKIHFFNTIKQKGVLYLLHNHTNETMSNVQCLANEIWQKDVHDHTNRTISILKVINFLIDVTVGMFHRFSQYLHVHDVCGNYVFIKIHIIRRISGL